MDERQYQEMVEKLAGEILTNAFDEEEIEVEAEEYDPVMEKIAAKYQVGQLYNAKQALKRFGGSLGGKAKALGGKAKDAAGAYADVVKGKGVARAGAHMDPAVLKQMAKETVKGTSTPSSYASEAKALINARRKARALQGAAIAAPAAAVGAAGAAGYAAHRKATEKAAEYLEEAELMKQAAMEVIAEAEMYEDAALEVLAELGYFDDEE